MDEDNYLSFNELLSESFVRDLIVFTLVFLFSIGQEWNSIFIFIFPLITFAFFMLFKIISINKWRIYPELPVIKYNPIGSEKKHANRLFFSSLTQLIFIFWLGAESWYHPQLIDDYNLYFALIFFFLYTFGYFWIFVDIGKYSKIKLNYQKEEVNIDELIGYLKIKKFKLISFINVLIFLLLNFLNFLFTFLTLGDLVPPIHLFLPGTGIEDSQPLSLPFFVVIILIISPLISIILLFLIYKDLTNIDPHHVSQLVDKLPKNIKILTLENFKVLNKNLIREEDLE